MPCPTAHSPTISDSLIIPHALGTISEYESTPNGTKKATIVDIGSSKAHGGWVELQYEDGHTEKLMKEDIFGILYDATIVHEPSEQ